MEEEGPIIKLNEEQEQELSYNIINEIYSLEFGKDFLEEKDKYTFIGVIEGSIEDFLTELEENVEKE